MRSSPGSDRDLAGEGEGGTGDGDVSGAARSGAQSELPLDELRALLDEAYAQLEAMEDRYKRALADLDNYRKRAERELERRVLERGDQTLRGWLEVVDSAERALSLETEDDQLAQGLRALLDQMRAILARQGVTRVGDVGEPFDPERHEAVGVMQSQSHPTGTIAEVARSGYAANGRMLRPAQVIVARPPADEG